MSEMKFGFFIGFGRSQTDATLGELAFEGREFVGVNGAAGAVEGDDDG